MKRTEVRVPKLVKLLQGRKTICADQLQALIEGAAQKSVTEEMARSILLQPKRTDILGIDKVINALPVRGRGLKIKLTREERERFSAVPFSEETLKMAAGHQWRGKRAILWWAPPERYGITMPKLRGAFGTSKDVQPCVWNNDWWLKEKFAKEVLKEGWHLTLAELPMNQEIRPTTTRKPFLTKGRELLTPLTPVETPVEVMYLCLVNYLANDSERLLYDCYSRTDALDSDGCVVDLGLLLPRRPRCLRLPSPGNSFALIGRKPPEVRLIFDNLEIYSF